MALKRYPPFLITALHISFWLVIIILPLSVRFAESPRGISWHMLHRSVWSNMLLVVVFYVHAYLLYPLQNRNGGYYIYALSLLLLCAFFLGLTSWIEHQFFPHRPEFMPQPRNPVPGFARRPGPPGWKPGFALLPFFSTIALSYCYRLLIDYSRQQTKVQEIENVHLKAELTFLRSQVSPHFMFNVLNNLVALARKKSDQIEPSLIKLSGLMRYMLYETDDSQISLATEIDYLKSYIDLQLLRFGDDVQVNMNFPDNMGTHRIEPMLLIPFVENAFKHGIGLVNNPVIDIDLQIADHHTIIFTVSNQFGGESQTKDRSSGIGLVNIRRRLALIYPNLHELVITSHEKQFMSRLTLKLSSCAVSL